MRTVKLANPRVLFKKSCFPSVLFFVILYMDFFTEEMQRVLLAAILGAVIGFEREWSGKPAGFRTLMLVSAGAALFTIISARMALQNIGGNSDITRIASNIVTGIGFVGAGIIFRGKSGVHGLTTAATVWVGAAIGMAVGIGSYQLAIVTTVIVWLILVVLHRLEWVFLKMGEAVEYKLHLPEHTEDKMDYHRQFFPPGKFKVIETNYSKESGIITVHVHVRASESNHREAIGKMLQDDNIIKLEYN